MAVKFEKTEVFNFEGALRGMRNPMDSWDKSDSGWGCYDGASPICRDRPINCPVPQYVIGPNDLDLALRLIRGGTEHRKFLRQIFICVDITAPRYWWQEFDTYKIGTTANSCSTMHKLKDYPFDRDMFEIDEDSWDDWWDNQIDVLEYFRVKYNETKNMKYLRTLKQRLPEAFLQKRTITSNYEVVLGQLRQREPHRLVEWNNDFCHWALALPYVQDFYEAASTEGQPRFVSSRDFRVAMDKGLILECKGQSPVLFQPVNPKEKI